MLKTDSLCSRPIGKGSQDRSATPVATYQQGNGATGNQGGLALALPTMATGRATARGAIEKGKAFALPL
jgi:hypothetical protein